MNLLQCFTAYAAVNRLMDTEMPYEDALALVTLRQNLRDKAEFFCTEERKLALRYGETGEDGEPAVKDGRLCFRTKEDAEGFAGKKAELCRTDAGETVKVTVAYPKSITPQTVLDLEGFAEFR